MIPRLDTMTISNGSKNVCLFTISGLISSATGDKWFVPGDSHTAPGARYSIKADSPLLLPAVLLP